MDRIVTIFRINNVKRVRGGYIGILATMLLTQSLLVPKIPSIEASVVARQVAPNAQTWRSQAESLSVELSVQKDENERLRDEIRRLQASQWKTFTATAYTADCAEGCSGITRSGADVRNTTHIGGKRVIATDPAVIPLGTTVEIRFEEGTTERAIAADTGGAIDGNIIDYLVSDKETALQFGRQTIKVRKVESE